MSDHLWALLAFVFQYGCVCLFGLCLQLPVCQVRGIRILAGFSFATAFLVLQPRLYYTETQAHGMNLAFLGCMAAWSMLHFTLMAPLNEKPAVLTVLSSTITHALEGICKVHSKFLRMQHQKPHPDSAGRKGAGHDPTANHSDSVRPLIVAEASDEEGDSVQAVDHARLRVILHEALATLLMVLLVYDVGMYSLCSLSHGMCDGGSYAGGTSNNTSESPTSEPGMRQQVSYLAKCTFAFPAGVLLTYHMDIAYCIIRLSIILGAFHWPSMRYWAEQSPARAFKWPVAAGSVTELWGFRWHQFLRFYFEGLGYAAVDKLLPQGKAHSTALRTGMRVVAAFVMSGVLHEYLTWAVFGRITGWYMAFFGVNCAAVLLEYLGPAVMAASRQPWQRLYSLWLEGKSEPILQASVAMPSTHTLAEGRLKPGKHAHQPASLANPYSYTLMKRVWALAFFFVATPMFVEPYRAAGFFGHRAFHLLGAPLTPQVLGQVHKLLQGAV